MSVFGTFMAAVWVCLVDCFVCLWWLLSSCALCGLVVCLVVCGFGLCGFGWIDMLCCFVGCWCRRRLDGFSLWFLGLVVWIAFVGVALWGWLLLDLVSGGFVLVVSCSCWVYVGVVVVTLDYRVDVCWWLLFWGGFRVGLLWCLVLGLTVLSW